MTCFHLDILYADVVTYEQMTLLDHAQSRDDARLVARTLAGDQGAFRQLFESYTPLVYRLASRMLGDPDAAADLTQDIFVRAYSCLASLRDGQAFQAWLTRLAVNMAHDQLRRRPHPTVSLDAPVGELGGVTRELPSTEPASAAHLLTAELHARVQAALLTLSPAHRAVVILHHLEQMPVEEIAAVLRVPAGTVKSRLARGRSELKRKLESYFDNSL